MVHVEPSEIIFTIDLLDPNHPDHVSEAVKITNVGNTVLFYEWREFPKDHFTV
jgi:hypothetical protein